jgi:hypothetical protein
MTDHLTDMLTHAAAEQVFMFGCVPIVAAFVIGFCVGAYF